MDEKKVNRIKAINKQKSEERKKLKRVSRTAPKKVNKSNEKKKEKKTETKKIALWPRLVYLLLVKSW